MKATMAILCPLVLCGCRSEAVRSRLSVLDNAREVRMAPVQIFLNRDYSGIRIGLTWDSRAGPDQAGMHVWVYGLASRGTNASLRFNIDGDMAEGRPGNAVVGNDTSNPIRSPAKQYR